MTGDKAKPVRPTKRSNGTWTDPRQPSTDEGRSEPLANRSISTKTPITTYQWVLVGSCAALYAVWEIIDHTWLMHIPMMANHGLDVAAAVVIVAVMSAAVFSTLGTYQKALSRLNADLTVANAALSKLEATRDQRLLELARDLSFAVSGLVGQAEIALQRTTDLPNIKALSGAVDRAQKIGAIAHDLLDLKQMTAGETDSGEAELRT
jgi:signal transduction histidine kinase